MRNTKKLQVFELADELAGEVYRVTVLFPSSERYGLTNQIRRAAVSVPSNLVEGCSRESAVEFRRYVEIALGSAMELEYQLGFALRLFRALEVFDDRKLSDKLASTLETVSGKAALLCKSLNSFIQTLRSES